ALHVCQRSLDLLRAMPAPTDCRQLVAVLVLLGQLHLAQSRAEEALSHLQEARTLATEGAAEFAPQELLDILTLLAAAYRALGRDEEAAQTLLEAQELLPPEQVMEVNLAAIYHGQGRLRKIGRASCREREEIS